MKSPDPRTQAPTSEPPTIALPRKRVRAENEDEFFSSTEIIVRLREKQFDGIVRRASLIRPIQHPSLAGSAKSPHGQVAECRVRAEWCEKGRPLCRRLLDVWPFGRTRRGKAQAWG